MKTHVLPDGSFYLIPGDVPVGVDGWIVPHTIAPVPEFGPTQKAVPSDVTVLYSNGVPVSSSQVWTVVEKSLSERIGPKTKLQLIRRMTGPEAAAFDNWLAALTASGVEAYESAAREWNAAQEIDPFDERTAQMLVVLEQQGLFSHDRILELFAL